MNVEKLHKLAFDIVEDNNEYQITTKFTNVVNHLNQMISQPQQPQHLNNFTSQLNALSTSLKKSSTNTLSPAWRQVLVDLDINDLFGEKLNEILINSKNENNITLPNLKPIYTSLQKRLETTIKAFEGLTSNLKLLKIEKHELEHGKCEIGILIPREFINNDLKGLEKELNNLNFILEHFSELITGDKESFELLNLSTSKPLITVATYIGIAAGIATTISGITTAYKDIIEIRNIKENSIEQQLPDELIKGMENFCDNKIDMKLKEMQVELAEKYTAIEDDGRKNEVLNGIDRSLRLIAERIDRGFNFEVRLVNQPIEDDENESDTSEQESIQEILDARENLEFMNMSGTPVLKLDTSENKDKTSPKNND